MAKCKRCGIEYVSHVNSDCFDSLQSQLTQARARIEALERVVVAARESLKNSYPSLSPGQFERIGEPLELALSYLDAAGKKFKLEECPDCDAFGDWCGIHGKE